MGSTAELDFFISYTQADGAWVRWIAAELEGAGYTTFSQAFDIRPGQDFVHEMHQAIDRAARTIMVMSPDYLTSPFGEAEWRATFARDPSGAAGLLIPVIVRPVARAGLLSGRVAIDLVEIDEVAARERLLAGVGPGERRPPRATFPGSLAHPGAGEAGRTPFPGYGSAVSNLPPRNRSFTGRVDLLERLTVELREATIAAVLPVEVVHGLGGVGKSELVLEFGHRFGRDYDIVWWIPAEQPAAAAASLVALASRLGLPASADQSVMIEGLFHLLRGRDRWLLIYDNAERPDSLDGLLPAGGPGHVLVTSRWPAWRARAGPLPLNVWQRAESVQFLTVRTGITDQAGLAELADLVGDLPLAVEEAAAYLEQTRVGLDEYLGLLRGRARELFGLGSTGSTPMIGDEADQRRVATVWSVSLDRVREQAPAAEALLGLFAFLGPDIPRDLTAAHADALSADLRVAVADPVTYHPLLAAVGRYSLVELDPERIRVHRLVQAVIRARLGESERTVAQVAVSLVDAAFPADGKDVARWPECERLLPHLLAVCDHAERLDIAHRDGVWLLCRAVTYLHGRGLYRQARTIGERALALADRRLDPDDVLQAGCRHRLGLVMRALDQPAAARDLFEQALRIAEADAEPGAPELGNLRGSMGNLLLTLGDLAGARAQAERALEITRNAHGEGHPDLAGRHNDLGRVLHEMGLLDAARTHLRRAIEIVQAAHGPDHHLLVPERGNLGSILCDLGELDSARAELERALEIADASYGPDHADVAVTRMNLSRVLGLQGDPAAARAELERAVLARERAVGADHSDCGNWRGHLGGMLLADGDLVAARRELESAARITESAYGADHVDVGVWRMGLGQVLHGLGLLEDARTEMTRALDIGESALGADHPEVGRRHGLLGQILQGLDDHGAARQQYEAALRILESNPGGDALEATAIRNNLGVVLRALDELPAAGAQLQRALRATEEILGPDHPDVGFRCGNLGLVLLELGEPAAARVQLERALDVGSAAYPEAATAWRRALDEALTALRMLDAARARLESALWLRENIDGAGHPDVAALRDQLGSVLRALDDLAGARRQFERALQISTSTLGRNHPRTRAVRKKLDELRPPGGRGRRGRAGRASGALVTGR